ncbi:MAG: PaaI family thioesterase [Brachybacterium sp.]|nr:PaaI family thioesterase [Brachybacterium sp.]
MLEYRSEELSEDQLAREREVKGGLAQSTRELVDAVIRSTIDDEELGEISTQIETLTARLRTSQIEGSFGVALSGDEVRNHGNAVVGLRNAIAPPLEVLKTDEGRAWADFTLGAAYEGPPGLVHGGVSALLLDQVFGEAAAAGGSPGMTGTLTLRYRRGTPLGNLHAEARIDRVEGVKTFVTGFIGDADGPTVEAEGIFILPKWARDLFEPKPFE